jgi:SNF2 family N-terminal domain.
LSSHTPKQSLVLDEDSNLWLTIEEPLDGFQEAMGVNFENQGKDRRHIFETDSLRRDRREISNASNAISELSLSIKYGSELSQDSVQQHSIDFLPHQLRPLALFQDKAGREGMLIADEVGTGKTYSAGLILHDGLMDGRIRRVLVVCPKSIEEKWHSTLRREFRITNCSKARSGKDLINWWRGNERHRF